jgi:hypothetical protein
VRSATLENSESSPSFADKFLLLAEMQQRRFSLPAILRIDPEGEKNMAHRNHGPLWNQDAVVAVGLAFAGMVLFESKLFPIAFRLNEVWLGRLAEWWPLLLIAAGLGLWLKNSLDKRSQKNMKPTTTLGDGK